MMPSLSTLGTKTVLAYATTLPTWSSGTEGIAWLAVAPKAELQPGAFYLDRSVVTQHVRRWKARQTYCTSA